jgi:hypothetical protein
MSARPLHSEPFPATIARIEPASEELIRLLEDLTGQRVPLPSRTVPQEALDLLGRSDRALGYSQLNELFLLLGYDRIAPAFFQYLVDAGTDYKSGAALDSMEQFREGVDRFRKLALLRFGNVKYAFKNLSRSAEDLEFWLDFTAALEEGSFADRHDPVQPLEQIPGEDTFYLGYLVQRELESRLKENPLDEEALRAEAKRKEIVQAGIRNHEAYLASDHLDVYVATSMRERHEYRFVADLTRQIFSNEELSRLRPRWFDPTQAYCHDRIDKGLSEALMLKRAKCTVYFAQETDTLGKDSELASTLAQGKPVIAFVPDPGPGYVDTLIARLKELYPERSERLLILEQLQIFEPAAAWRDPLVRGWLDGEDGFDLPFAMERLSASLVSHYERRARMLREDHPLGIQVNLTTGVANGVLVVRNAEDCARLIRCVLLRTLEFDLETRAIEGQDYVFLRERISRSIFRVMTGDAMLTNAFWNFYLEP